MFKQMVSLILAFIFGLQYVAVLPEIYAQNMGVSDNNNEEELIYYYQQLDHIGNSVDTYNGFPSTFVVADNVNYPLVIIPFLVGEVYEVVPINKGKIVYVKTKDRGSDVVYELLWSKEFTDLDLKPEKGNVYMFSYIPYQYDNNDIVTFLTRIWDIQDVPDLVYDNNDNVVYIGNENTTENFTKHYYETKYKVDKYSLQNICPANVANNINEDILKQFIEVIGNNNFDNFIEWYISGRTQGQATKNWVVCYFNYLQSANPDYVIDLFKQYGIEKGLIPVPSSTNTGLVRPDTSIEEDNDGVEILQPVETPTEIDNNEPESNGSIFGSIFGTILDEADELEGNLFNLANLFINETLDDVSININRNNNRNWEVGQTTSNIVDSIAGIMNTGITTTGDVINTGITTTGSVINTAIETTPQTLTAIMPILIASQEQLHELEDAIGEDINHLIDTSIIKIARDALAARFSTLAFQGIRSIPRALIGDVSSVNLTNDLESVIPDNIQMPTDINFPNNLEDYDLMAAMLMDTNRDGKIKIREMRQAVRANRKSLPIIQRIFNVLSRRDMRQANQVRRDYNKGRITPTAYKNGVPVNTAMAGQFNQPSYPGNIDLGFGGSNSQFGETQPFFSNLGGVSQQNSGGFGQPLTPLGELSNSQRGAIEEQLIAQGYEVDYDNPITLDFNHDGKIDKDERDLAVKLDREGMNTVRSMLSRVTRKPNRDASQAARQYNRGNNGRSGLLGGIGSRGQNDGNAQWQGGTQIPQPSIQPYPGQPSQLNSPGIEYHQTAVPYPTQPGDSGSDRNGIFNRNRDRNGVFNRNKDKGEEPYTGQLKPPYVCIVSGPGDRFNHQMQSPQSIPVVNNPYECTFLGFGSGDYAVSLEDFNKALQSKGGQVAVLELIYGDVNGERGIYRLIPGDKDNKKKGEPPVVIQLTGAPQQPTYPVQGGQIGGGQVYTPTQPIGAPSQGTGLPDFGNNSGGGTVEISSNGVDNGRVIGGAIGDFRDVVTNQLSGGILGSGNLNSASLNQLPGNLGDVTSQRGQISTQEITEYVNNMAELEKLAAAIEKGTSGIYARNEQEEMNTLKTIENTILIYQRMIEMGVGAFQEDGYYYYQISNTGVRSKEAGNNRVYPITNYFLKRLINYLNENNVGAARDQLNHIRCYEGLPQSAVGCGASIYSLHQWTTTKVPMDNAERQLRILLRQVNPLLTNSLVSGGSNTIPTTTGVSTSESAFNGLSRGVGLNRQNVLSDEDIDDILNLVLGIGLTGLDIGTSLISGASGGSNETLYSQPQGVVQR